MVLANGASCEGLLGGLTVLARGDDDVVRFGLRIGAVTIALDAMIDSGIEIAIDPRPVCVGCGTRLVKRPSHGHCYECFTTKASMDLCYVAPARCHFAAGTCREPAWGEAVCQQVHSVYLANSGGLKVGLTRHADGVPRWIEQGATAGVVIAKATSRRHAGLLEERIGAFVNDKSDWRRQVTGRTPDIDLEAERARIRAKVALPEGCIWETHAVHEILYPIVRPLRRVVRIKYPQDGLIRGRLTGIVGSFLLLDHGAFHVGEHRGYHIRFTSVGPIDDLQGELF